MTALPATRAAADDEVARAERAMYEATGPLSGPWKRIFALARKGAETVGATEAWLYSPRDRSEQTTIEAGAYYTIKEHGEEDWEGEPDRPIVRRCLILPDES